MKALILAGGNPQRFRAAPLAMPKPLVPVANRPVIDYLIDQLQAAGIAEVGVVLDNRDGPVGSWPGWRRRPGMKFLLLEQSLPLGTAHAVKVGQDFVGEGPFLVVTGDCFFDGGLEGLVDRHRAHASAVLAMVAGISGDRNLHGIASLEGDRVVRVVEKPQGAGDGVALTGAYVLDRRVFDAINVVKPSVRGELEITGAIQILVERGQAVRAYRYGGFWRDVGRPAGILEANVFQLDRLAGEMRGEATGSRIEGRVVLATRSRVINSTVLGPVAIGEGAAVINSWVGPFCAIGSHSVLEDVEVQRSVILPNCRLRGIGRLEESLLGEGVTVGKRGGKPRVIRMLVAEGSEVEVP